MRKTSRRSFLQSASSSVACLAAYRFAPTSLPESSPNLPLDEFGYADVSLSSELHELQFQNTHAVLMNLSEDSMLKPLRAMSGFPRPAKNWRLVFLRS